MAAQHSSARMCLPLVLVLLRAQGAEAGGEYPWYKYAWEFAAVETAMLMVMILIAVVSDLGWHRLTHYVQNETYKFGGKDEAGRNEHKQLYFVLLHKMGEEFMSLGLLALIVFMFEKYGVFDMLVMEACAYYEDDCIHLPQTGLDWFHMAEVVHFSLFFGMCLYFVMMYCFVSGSIRDIKMWESFRKNELALIKSHTNLDRQMSEPNPLGYLPAKAQYQMMHDRFIRGVMYWELAPDESKNAKFTKLLAHLGVEPDDGYHRVVVDETLRGRSFNFSAFLSLCVEHAVDDAIEVHISSWVVVWIFLAISFPLHRYLRINFSEITLAAVSVPTVVWLFLCLIAFRHVQNSMARKSRCMHGVAAESESSEDESEVAQPLEINDMSRLDSFLFSGHHLMRFAQIAGFLVSYVISRQAFEPPEWDHNFNLSLASIVTLGSVYLILSVWFFYHAPLFLALMSLPPGFSKSDEKILWNLLTSGFKQELMQAYMEEKAATRDIRTSLRSRFSLLQGPIADAD